MFQNFTNYFMVVGITNYLNEDIENVNCQIEKLQKRVGEDNLHVFLFHDSNYEISYHKYEGFKNFTFKTGVRTFEAAAYLRKCGIDIIRVKKWFQSDLKTYTKISKIIDKIKILNNNLTNEEIEKTVKLASVNGENIINKFNSSKMKGRKNKLECFCKLIAVMNNSSYITPIILNFYHNYSNKYFYSDL